MKIKNREVESTPTAELCITVKGESVYMLRTYWTANSGTYGYQVAYQVWDWSESYTGGKTLEEKVTGGCGYCKESEAFRAFLSYVFGRYTHTGGTAADMLRGTKYHKGGNYYEIPLKSLKRIVKKGGK